MDSNKIFTKTANAKINLYLHVLKKRDDGYHDLDSLIGFADFGDEISLKISDKLSFEITGTFSKNLSEQEITLERNSKNILAKTLWLIADFKNQKPLFNIKLTKNIPLGAGLGGGSADAAALAQILCSIWGINVNSKDFQDLLFSIGADVPVCFKNQSCRIIGTGKHVLPSPKLPRLSSILIHPNKHCSTEKVFKNNQKISSKEIATPHNFKSENEILSFLESTKNDLTISAQNLIPDIKDIINILKENGAHTPRMSGSGSACFGLFENEYTAQNASNIIQASHPEWWVQTTTIS